MKKLISAFLVVSGLAFLTACDAGTAAQIGETKISVNTVQSRIAEINDARREFDTSQIQLVVGEELNRTQVRFLVIAEIFKKLANKNGIEITQAMKDSRKAEIFNSIGGADQLDQALVSAQMAPSDFDLYIEALLISDKLVERAVAAGIAEADAQTAIQQLVLEFTKTEVVRINPQYGTWDPTIADLDAFDAAGTAVKSITA